MFVPVSDGKRHDFKLLKSSKVHFVESTEVLTDTAYLGLQKTHCNTSMPKKKSKKHPSTQKEQKKRNKELSSQRVLNEHVIGMIKRYKIVADRISQ